MGDTDTPIHSARHRAAADMAPAINDQNKKPGGATGQATLPAKGPGKPADAGAGRPEQSLMAAHTKDTKHLEFYGENIPNRRNTKTDKMYKRLHETFGSVDEAVRHQQALLGLSSHNTGLVKDISAIKEKDFIEEDFVKEEAFLKEEDFIKEEEEED